MTIGRNDSPMHRIASVWFRQGNRSNQNMDIVRVIGHAEAGAVAGWSNQDDLTERGHDLFAEYESNAPRRSDHVCIGRRCRAKQCRVKQYGRACGDPGKRQRTDDNQRVTP